MEEATEKDIGKQIDQAIEQMQQEKPPEYKGTMLHLKVPVKTMREFLELCMVVTDELMLVVKSRGIRGAAYDASHSLFGNVTLAKGAFTEFSAVDTEIGLDLKMLHNILKYADKDVVLDYGPEDNRLIVTMGALKRKMSLISGSEMTAPSSPSTMTTAKFKMHAAHFSKIITACEQISDNMRIIADSDSVDFFARDGIEEVEEEITKDMTDLVEDLEVSGTASNSYDLKFLVEMVKGAKDKISFGMASERPVTMEFSFADEKGYVNYHLAQRVESEENTYTGRKNNARKRLERKESESMD